jgi:hypothetical protein
LQVKISFAFYVPDKRHDCCGNKFQISNSKF